MTAPSTGRPRSIEELLALLARADGAVDSTSRNGDPIGVLAHSLQCGELLWRSHPNDDELIAAGLVHDLGHVVTPGRPSDHGRIGAELIRRLLGDGVAELVALHIPAKRYLVATDGDSSTATAYQDILSHDSTVSLGAQGGPMDAAEVADFAFLPHAERAVALRRADDRAKVPGLAVRPVEFWRPLLERVRSSSAGHRI